MCVIVYKEKESPYPITSHHMMWEANPHGMGIAWYDKAGQIQVRKTLDKYEGYDLLDQHKRKQLVVHYRFATAGKIEEEQCHPFVVTTDLNKLLLSDYGDEVLAHNGIISGYGNDYFSDTIEFIVTKFAKIKRPNARLNFLKNSVAGNFAYMTSGMVHLVGNWEVYEEVMVTNTHFLFEYHQYQNNRILEGDAMRKWWNDDMFLCKNYKDNVD